MTQYDGFGFVGDPVGAGYVASLARPLSLQATRAEASNPEEYRRAFERLRTEGVKGVVLLADPMLIDHAANIADLAKTTGLPTVFQRRENVQAGGLCRPLNAPAAFI